jgi:hypothetical protein
MGERWMRLQLTNPSCKLRPAFEKVRHIAPRLLEAWLTHWNTTHLYSPIELHHADSVDSSHVKMLLDLGFSEIDCPFRLWEVGVLWARLPAA